jgi:transposase-like protein
MDHKKECSCGGRLYRHGQQYGAQRYRCGVCHKTITIRDGKQTNVKDKAVQDWRYVDERREK